MPNGLIPRNFWTFPTLRMPSVMEDLLEETRLDTIPSGLSVSEDNKNFYIDAALPGIDPKKIEVTFDNGILHVSGEAKEEEKEKKYYRKATSSFSYRVSVPTDVNPKTTPEATYKDGMMHIVFKKTAPSKPKKIEVKTV
ncbi:MAG: hypothetical protein ACD_30C00047G0008 [uncultured bacterium]|uniref:SHSP domain-containing protein n=4 Tax=Candidatus Daviesiibacteriota TaxID=1752718 RepID=A0A0G0EUZ5_9BACT|nr:MAG: hypothetical protein ACD_30C00047G0008 [uncultured bacterium]KKQ10723.1 MAG: hypothetical protein US19_C0001G0061 [Candidatus Daviesbacteria bacterium GW2011_GWB1_36_5]KKQ15835.1 MAG: hypothetical protein US28_C0009G0014 [Candidatus Daviesbacteria bacterium GW2011_GWA1_36_8]OGE16885.1 MAG: hypothetical protein A2858_03205 [Candidatus Daviesbacteria bacterium RIFCSPHIGHO2_01_FULL_36_37]OGE31241.1 MAG: hypothetical protein A3C99_01180 [Candidatus Daviesbacteria bacterium RIFCSPHIGHO2_02_F